jgi:anaphase-promoting complex subunit 8
MKDTSTVFKPLLAAVYYHRKEFDKSCEYFGKITENTYFELDYIDLYSNILYIRQDVRKLASLSKNATLINRIRPETLCAVANYYSLKGDHLKAIEYFKRSAEYDTRFNMIYTLIGHEYVGMKNIAGAIKSYTKAIRYNPCDHRAWFGMAQAYTSTCMHEYAAFFYRKSTELKRDESFMWMKYGETLVKIRRKEDATKCFMRAIELGDVNGYLKIGDIYKNDRKYSEAVGYYEKYVHESAETEKDGENVGKICEFLREYFGKTGNHKKEVYYLELYERKYAEIERNGKSI